MPHQDLLDFVVKMGQFVSAAVTLGLLLFPEMDPTIPSAFLLIVNLIAVCVIIVMQVCGAH